MGILSKFKKAFKEPDIVDEHLYAAIADELSNGYRREGLWAKANAETNFDDNRAKSLYMRMAVKALRNELIEASNQKQQLMDNAINLFNSEKYEQAYDGLLLRVNFLNDLDATACLAYMKFNGSGTEENREEALEYLANAELSEDAVIREWVARMYEDEDWEKALEHYDYSMAKGNKEAAANRRRFILKLKEQGVIKRGFFEQFFI
jgi:TPR repeat protein